MKKEIEIIEKEYFIANDGRSFSTEKACVEHENMVERIQKYNNFKVDKKLLIKYDEKNHFHFVKYFCSEFIDDYERKINLDTFFFIDDIKQSRSNIIRFILAYDQRISFPIFYNNMSSGNNPYSSFNFQTRRNEFHFKLNREKYEGKIYEEVLKFIFQKDLFSDDIIDTIKEDIIFQNFTNKLNNKNFTNYIYEFCKTYKLLNEFFLLKNKKWFDISFLIDENKNKQDIISELLFHPDKEISIILKLLLEIDNPIKFYREINNYKILKSSDKKLEFSTKYLKEDNYINIHLTLDELIKKLENSNLPEDIINERKTILLENIGTKGKNINIKIDELSNTIKKDEEFCNKVVNILFKELEIFDNFIKISTNTNDNNANLSVEFLKRGYHYSVNFYLKNKSDIFKGIKADVVHVIKMKNPNDYKSIKEETTIILDNFMSRENGIDILSKEILKIITDNTPLDKKIIQEVNDLIDQIEELNIKLNKLKTW